MICFRHKESGQIYTLLSSVTSSSGSYYILGTDDKEVLHVDCNKIFEEFDEILPNELDYDKVWPLVKNYMHLNRGITDLFAAFFRRLDKNYYEPGKYVIILRSPEKVLHIEERLFRIKEIFVVNNQPHERELVLEAANSIYARGREIRFALYEDRFTDSDAYNNVKRLDLPY